MLGIWTLEAFKGKLGHPLSDLLTDVYLDSCTEQGFGPSGLIGPFQLNYSVILWQALFLYDLHCQTHKLNNLQFRGSTYPSSPNVKFCMMLYGLLNVAWWGESTPWIYIGSPCPHLPFIHLLITAFDCMRRYMFEAFLPGPDDDPRMNIWHVSVLRLSLLSTEFAKVFAASSFQKGTVVRA